MSTMSCKLPVTLLCLHYCYGDYMRVLTETSRYVVYGRKPLLAEG